MKVELSNKQNLFSAGPELPEHAYVEHVLKANVSTRSANTPKSRHNARRATLDRAAF